MFVDIYIKTNQQTVFERFYNSAQPRNYGRILQDINVCVYSV